jgi:hypothetical protein
MKDRTTDNVQNYDNHMKKKKKKEEEEEEK